MMTLRANLEAFRRHVDEIVPGEKAAVMARADTALAATFDRTRPPAPGSTVPAFTLPDQFGRSVQLRDQLRGGSVVLLFFRGGWCPFCSLTLRAWQRELVALRATRPDHLARSGRSPTLATTSGRLTAHR